MEYPLDRRSATSGFTLVELMVVVLLIGIMTALVVPEMRGTFSDAVLRGSSRDLVSVCALASSRAVSFNQEHRVRIDPASHKFRLERRVRGRQPGARFVPVREISGGEGEIDARLTVRVVPWIEGSETAGDDAGGAGIDSDAVAGGAVQGPVLGVSFYPDGTSDRAEIVLRDPEGFGLRLRLNPVTGRVRILEFKRT